MKNIDTAVTKKIAKLARLRLTDTEIEKYTKDLDSILGFVAQLNEVNTDGIEPLVHGYAMETHFREDKAIPMTEEQIKKMLACSEAVLYEQYKVPQVLGGE
jgi:aspartyl-tRNA(Asn)/glutamyl-tRNA(Gln) amidotransferase subunit C